MIPLSQLPNETYYRHFVSESVLDSIVNLSKKSFAKLYVAFASLCGGSLVLFDSSIITK